MISLLKYPTPQSLGRRSQLAEVRAASALRQAAVALLVVLSLLVVPETMAQIVTEGREGANYDVYRFYPRYNDNHGMYKQKLLKYENYKRAERMWHVESAWTMPRHAGNASLLSASRFGLTERIELSTYAVEDIFRPTLYAKVHWKTFKKRYFLSSRFNIANAYSGMKIFQKKEVDRIIAQNVDIPLVFEVGHELLFTKAWYSDPNCTDGTVYMAMTGGIGVYGGFCVNGVDDLDQIRFHFLANRGETLTGNGFRLRFKYWIDGRITANLYVHGGVSYHVGSFLHHHALELQGEAEYIFRLFYHHWGAKLGFLTSFANYTKIDKHAAIWPIVDLSFYFGNPRHKSSDLFTPGVYKEGKNAPHEGIHDKKARKYIY